MKTRILALLQTSDQPISGEHLSRQLGISRVAVWKHIRQMRAAGSEIASGPKGYRLLSHADALMPWMFGERAGRVHHYDQLPSTMDKAMELAQTGCENFSVVVADHQTRGRGRLQRCWQSDNGGLYFTVIIKPHLDPWAAPLINLAAALDLADTLNTLFPIHARIKWPNDVLVEELKIAGILSQMATEADRIHFICLGIGVNVNNRPPDPVPTAVSVAQLLGRPVSRALVLSEFLDRFERRLETETLADVVPEWKKHSVTLGRPVVVQTIHETIQGGIAIDLDQQGGLVLAMPDGGRRTVIYGDCFHGVR